MPTNFLRKANAKKISLTLDDLQALEEALLNRELCTCKERYVQFETDMLIIEPTTSKKDCVQCREHKK